MPEISDVGAWDRNLGNVLRFRKVVYEKKTLL